MVNLPAGITTIRGQASAHSLNSQPAVSASPSSSPSLRTFALLLLFGEHRLGRGFARCSNRFDTAMGSKPKYAEEGTKKRHPGSRYPPAAVNGSRKHHGSEHDRHYFT